jgi:uncharacterized cupin superfamily protein
MSDPNVFDATFAYEGTEPEGYRAGEAVGVGKQAGGSALAVRLYEAQPGQSLCPYHYEYEEEWLLVLEGTIVLRTPEGEQDMVAGEMVAFPPGPAGAHKTTNRGEQSARLLMFSSAREPAFAVYPDSDKIGAWSGNKDDDVLLFRRDGDVGYYDGEL